MTSEKIGHQKINGKNENFLSLLEYFLSQNMPKWPTPYCKEFLKAETYPNSRENLVISFLSPKLLFLQII